MLLGRKSEVFQGTAEFCLANHKGIINIPAPCFRIYLKRKKILDIFGPLCLLSVQQIYNKLFRSDTSTSINIVA